MLVNKTSKAALCVLQIEVLRAVVGEVQGSAAGGRVNSDLRQRVTEVGVACPRSLARVDDLAAGMTDVIGAWIGYGADALRHTLMRLNLLTRSWTRMFAVVKALFTPTTNEWGIKPKRDIRYNQFNKKHGRSIPRNNLGQNNGYHAQGIIIQSKMPEQLCVKRSMRWSSIIFG